MRMNPRVVLCARLLFEDWDAHCLLFNRSMWSGLQRLISRTASPSLLLRKGIRRFYLNQYCNVDVERLGSAVGPQETGMALGLTGNDALRLFDRIASNGARLMQK
eukprot:scaffold169413_cov27-Tisochrysis_lutea.AAC.2